MKRWFWLGGYVFVMALIVCVILFRPQRSTAMELPLAHIADRTVGPIVVQPRFHAPPTPTPFPTARPAPTVTPCTRTVADTIIRGMIHDANNRPIGEVEAWSCGDPDKAIRDFQQRRAAFSK